MNTIINHNDSFKAVMLRVMIKNIFNLRRKMLLSFQNRNRPWVLLMSLGTHKDLFQKLQCSTRQWLAMQLDDFAPHKSTSFLLSLQCSDHPESETKKTFHCILAFIVRAETFHYFITLLDTLKGNAFETRKFHLKEESMQNFRCIRRGGVLHTLWVCIWASQYGCISEVLKQ